MMMIREIDIRRYAAINNPDLILPISRKRKNFAYDDELFEFEPWKKPKPTRENLTLFFKEFFPKTFKSKPQLFDFLSAPLRLNKSSGKRIVIKNIGNLKKEHLKNALKYAISNSSRGLLAIDENMQLREMDLILDDWQANFSKKDLNEGLHLIFSLNEEINDDLMEVLELSVFETMKEKLTDYKFALIPHDHQGKPHVHVILNKTNQKTLKRLRFDNKKEVRTFFKDLREGFKNNLFVLSNGALAYDNPSPAILINEKINKLEDFIKNGISQEKPESNDLRLIRSIRQDLIKRKTSLNKRIELKYPEVVSFVENSNGMDSKVIPKFVKMSEQFFKWTDEKKEIDDKIDELLEIENNFERFMKNKSALEKKEQLLRFFKNINNRHLSNKTRKNIFNLEKMDIPLEESAEKALDSISNLNDQSPKAHNLKSLTKQLYFLKKIRKLIKRRAFK